MTLPDLTVVPAGAGSGKTHRIKEDLGQWVVDKKVAPEKILAVTFTEAAAAELKDRIRRELLQLGRLEEAQADADCGNSEPSGCARSRSR